MDEKGTTHDLNRVKQVMVAAVYWQFDRDAKLSIRKALKPL